MQALNTISKLDKIAYGIHDDPGDNPGQATEGSTVSSIKCNHCWHLD